MISPTKNVDVTIGVHDIVNVDVIADNNLATTIVDDWAPNGTFSNLMTPNKVPTRVENEMRRGDDFHLSMRDVVQSIVKKQERNLQGCRDDMEEAQNFLNSEKVKLAHASIKKGTL